MAAAERTTCGFEAMVTLVQPGQRHRPGRDRRDRQHDDPGHVPAQRHVLQREPPAQQPGTHRIISDRHAKIITAPVPACPALPPAVHEQSAARKPGITQAGSSRGGVTAVGRGAPRAGSAGEAKPHARGGQHRGQGRPRCRRSSRTSFHPRLRGRYGPPGRICLAFSFRGGRLGQHRPGKLPRLSHREACPPGAFAARALAEADEDPRGRMTRIAEREPADREFPPAARTQVLVPSIRTRARIWTWPHHAPPGFRPAAAAYTPAGLGNNRGAVIPACARHSPNQPASPATIRRRPVRGGHRGPGTPAAR